MECAFLGTGQPVPFPEPGGRDLDAAFLADNRWVSLARKVAGSLRAPAREIPGGRRDDILRALSSSSVLIFPAVIEGQSRLQLEARAVGTVPVALRSNRFAAGVEEGGGVMVDSVEAMAPEIDRLLASPEELADRSTVAVKTASEQMDWQAYVARVDAALSAPGPADPNRAVRARMGEAVEGVLAERDALRAEADELQRGVEWLREVRAAGERERQALSKEVAWLRDAADRSAEERDGARRSLERLRSRRSVRLATRLTDLFGRRRRD